MKVPPRVSPHMTAQASLDAQLETGNSPFADFTQFPEPGSDVSLTAEHFSCSKIEIINLLIFETGIMPASIIGE